MKVMKKYMGGGYMDKKKKMAHGGYMPEMPMDKKIVIMQEGGEMPMDMQMSMDVLKALMDALEGSKDEELRGAIEGIVQEFGSKLQDAMKGDEAPAEEAPAEPEM